MWIKGADTSKYNAPDLSHIRAVDQGKTKGCGLAVVLYLRQFQGEHTPDVADPRDFETLYTRMNLDPTGYNSTQRLMEDVDTTTLQYTWFQTSARKRKTRSMPRFHPDIQGPEDVLKYLRRLLDTGHVFAAPFDGHFCTYVAYNDEGFLALGSYGNKGMHEVKETIRFAAAVKDCMYVRISRSKMKTSITTVK